MEIKQNLEYLYDGSLEGFLCCIYEAYVRKEIPGRIRQEVVLGEQEGLPLEDQVWIQADFDHANKVYASLEQKINFTAQDFIKKGFLITHPHREQLLFDFIRQGYRYGATVFDRLTDDSILALTKAIRNLEREAHNYMGFIRFSQYEKVLVACISPENRVLPLLSDHFSQRLPQETFLIYDRRHQMALVHKEGQTLLTAMSQLILPDISDAEKAYHTLWRCFQKTIAIKERTNPKCQMNHMPKRYWRDMTEFWEADQAQ